MSSRGFHRSTWTVTPEPRFRAFYNFLLSNPSPVGSGVMPRKGSGVRHGTGRRCDRYDHPVTARCIRCVSVVGPGDSSGSHGAGDA